ncbi:prostatic acid phosphatase-like [Amphibalanus amphitrite]|uniref:prostatic acid phosphatase-like n=1 Tax=Amphibalanus amphitrite TaxID=1232801 RepID=UPI001C8FC319|nr:prostatic acid phosphatase-like [Amphibalanus amphitrite]
MGHVWPLLLSASLWLSVCAAGDNSTLQLVQVLFRHGARTPVVVCPTDPHRDLWLDDGLGQLTNQGKQMQFELGQFLRTRYGGFLSEKYHENYTLVRASDVDRTLMSAEVNLAGLYPPKGRDVWNPDLAWQPIPVHTEPITSDRLLNFMAACPRYAIELKRVLNTTPLRLVEKQNQPLYEYLSQHCGAPVRDLEQAMLLFDLLLIEDARNWTLPAWATARLAPYNATVYPDVLKPLTELAFDLLSYDAALRRLGGGALLADITEHLSQKVSGTLSPPNRELFMYSGHDSDVAALLGALGVYNGIAPPLASCVIVELHRDASGAFFVELFYRNDTAVEPYQLRLPNCTGRCPWVAFRDLTAPVRVQDGAAECAPPPSGTPTAQEVTIIALAVSLTLLLVLCAIGLFIYCRRNRNGALTYSHFGEING